MTHAQDDEMGLLTARLKRLKPLKLRVHTAEGDQREVKMPVGRKRWEQLRRILSGLRWVRVESLDARSNVIDVFEGIPLADDELELGGDIDVRVVQLVRQIVQVALDAQDKAVMRNTEHMREALESTVKVNRALAEQLTSTMRLYDQKLKILDKFHDDDGDGELMSGKFLEALPALIQMANANASKGSTGNGAT